MNPRLLLDHTRYESMIADEYHEVWSQNCRLTNRYDPKTADQFQEVFPIDPYAYDTNFADESSSVCLHLQTALFWYNP